MTEPPRPASTFREILTALADDLLEYTKAPDRHAIIARMEKRLAWLKEGAPPKVKKTRPPSPEQVQAKVEKERAASQGEQATVERLWGAFQAGTRLHGWTLTPERRQRLLAAHRAGMTLPKFEAAVRGMTLTPWANGTARDSSGHEYEIHVVLKHADKFADRGGYRAEVPGGPGPAKVVDEVRIKRLEKEIEDAERRGNIQRSEALASELAALTAGSGDRSLG